MEMSRRGHRGRRAACGFVRSPPAVAAGTAIIPCADPESGNAVRGDRVLLRPSNPSCREPLLIGERRSACRTNVAGRHALLELSSTAVELRAGGPSDFSEGPFGMR